MNTDSVEDRSVFRETMSEYEIERGKPMPSKNHGLIQANLIGAFLHSRDYRPSSEMTLEIGLGHPVTPDISLIPRQSMDLLNDEIRVTTPPVTVVEIVSPSQTSAEMMKKVHGYLARGVQSCWLVDPSLHQVIIFIADGTRRVFSEGIAADPVTGITADLAMVFFMTRTSGAAAGRPDCGLHRAGAWQNMGGNKDPDNEHS